MSETLAKSTMVSAILLTKNPGQTNWRNMGIQNFHEVPRIGERIDLEIDDLAYSYEVVAIHHTTGSARPFGIIYAVRLGRNSDVIVRLFEASPDADRSI